MKGLTKKCESTAQILKALSHPLRLQILCHLADGGKTVGEIEELCGASQSAVSQFLGRMKSEGLLQSTREARYVTYEIADARILQLMKALHRIFCA